MTPLEVQAKAGDPAAVNELLRLSMPRVKAIVYAALRGSGLPFDDFPDAFAEGMITLWRCLPAWRGDVPLTAYAAKPIRSRMFLFAKRSRRRTRITDSLDATLPNPERVAFGRETPLVETIAAQTADPDAPIDAGSVLAAMKPAQATLLWRIAAEGEEQAEIADETSTSRQNIHLKYNRAVANARTLLAA